MQAGAATPPEHRTSRELREPTHEQAAPVVEPMAVPEGGTLECGSASEPEESEMDPLRAKLVYRRAGHVATSALAHYHRGNRPGRSSIQSRILAKEPQEARRTGTVIPEHFVSTTGPGNQMVKVEVDSKEGSDNEEDFTPKLNVRSATQAAAQAMRGAHWQRQRAAMTGA